MRRFLLFCCAFLQLVLVFGQEEAVDSLRHLLKKHQSNDTVRVQLMHELASTLISDAPEKALHHAEKAGELSQMLNYEAGIAETNIIKGHYYEETGKPDTALKHFRKAKILAARLNNKALFTRTLRQIALYYNRHDAYDSALVYYRKEYQLRKNDSTGSLVALMSDIAVNYYNLGNFEKALDISVKALNISKSIKDLRGKQHISNLIASILNRQGNIDSAIYYFKKALEVARKRNNKRGILTANNNIANIYGDRGNYPKALDYYLLTLKAAEDMGHEMAMAVTYNNIAIVFYSLKEYDETIKYLRKSLAISRKNKDRKNVANTLNNIAELYIKQDSLQKAMAYYNEAYAIISQLNHRYFKIHNLYGKGLIYSKLHNNDSAYYYYSKSLKIAKELDARKEMADCFIGLAKYYYREKAYEKTTKVAKKALELAQKLGNVELIRDAAKMLHRSSAEMLRHHNAYKFLKLYTEMHDSLLSADNTKEITQLEMQYKHEKEMQKREAKEAMRELQRQKELAKQKGIRNAFIIAFILVMFIVVMVIRNSRQKQRVNQQLSLQKAEIEEKNEELQQLMAEISRQKDQIEASHTKITDSIKYAERIQNALFPLKDNITNYFDDYFIYYQPLEIVSGDFYWIEKVHNHILVAVGDCTGHGVPGAMMSMLGISYLNDIARQPQVTAPNQVLHKLRKRIKRSLHQTGDVRESRDGMDLAFVAINMLTGQLDYAGANNPMILFRDGEPKEFKADKQPISVYHDEKEFTTQSMQLQKGDIFYLFSDGFRDQFQAGTGKKYGRKNFKNLLSRIHREPMHIQYEILREEMNQWMINKMHQIDDILVTGFRW